LIDTEKIQKKQKIQVRGKSSDEILVSTNGKGLMSSIQLKKELLKITRSSQSYDLKNVVILTPIWPKRLKLAENGQLVGSISHE
jgi:hypothetical protein